MQHDPLDPSDLELIGTCARHLGREGLDALLQLTDRHSPVNVLACFRGVRDGFR